MSNQKYVSRLGLARNYAFSPGHYFGLDWNQIKADHPTPVCSLVVLDGRQIELIYGLVTVFPKYYKNWGMKHKSSWNADQTQQWDEIEAFISELEYCLMSGCDMKEFIATQKSIYAALSGKDIDTSLPLPKIAAHSLNGINVEIEKVGTAIDVVGGGLSGDLGAIATMVQSVGSLIESAIMLISQPIQGTTTIGLLIDKLEQIRSSMSSNSTAEIIGQNTNFADLLVKFTSLTDILGDDIVIGSVRSFLEKLVNQALQANAVAINQHLATQQTADNINALKAPLDTIASCCPNDALYAIRDAILITAPAGGAGPPEPPGGSVGTTPPPGFPDILAYNAYKCGAANRITDDLINTFMAMSTMGGGLTLIAVTAWYALLNTTFVGGAIVGVMMLGFAAGTAATIVISAFILLALSGIGLLGYFANVAVGVDKQKLVCGLYGANTAVDAKIILVDEIQASLDLIDFTGTAFEGLETFFSEQTRKIIDALINNAILNNLFEDGGTDFNTYAGTVDCTGCVTPNDWTITYGTGTVDQTGLEFIVTSAPSVNIPGAVDGTHAVEISKNILSCPKNSTINAYGMPARVYTYNNWQWDAAACPAYTVAEGGNQFTNGTRVSSKFLMVYASPFSMKFKIVTP